MKNTLSKRLSYLMTSIPIFPFFLRSSFLPSPSLPGGRDMTQGWKTHNNHLKWPRFNHRKQTKWKAYNREELHVSAFCKLSWIRKRLGLPLNLIPSKQRYPQCPWQSGSGKGETLLALCVEVALSTAHSWPASGAPPCRLWSSPFFLWPETMSSIRSSRTAV